MEVIIVIIQWRTFFHRERREETVLRKVYSQTTNANPHDDFFVMKLPDASSQIPHSQVTNSPSKIKF